MNVKQGDFVNVEGVESIIETSWAQGKHRVFKLSDGRVILDLDKLVASGKATIVVAVEKVGDTSLYKLGSVRDEKVATDQQFEKLADEIQKPKKWIS